MKKRLLSALTAFAMLLAPAAVFAENDAEAVLQDAMGVEIGIGIPNDIVDIPLPTGEITVVPGDIVDYVKSGTCGSDLTWVLDGGKLTISGSGVMDKWYSYSDVPWYNYCDNITSVIINDGVTSIGRYAFFECRNLSSINISTGVTCIGDFAFDNCDSLTSISLPNGLTSIGYAAFQSCTGLMSINHPRQCNKHRRMDI